MANLVNKLPSKIVQIANSSGAYDAWALCEDGSAWCFDLNLRNWTEMHPSHQPPTQSGNIAAIYHDRQLTGDEIKLMATPKINERFFVVVVLSEEVQGSLAPGGIMTKQGTRFLVLETPDGWTVATSRYYDGKIASDAMAFSTREIAEEFAKKWTGHPWWCKPSGQFEVIEVAPRYRQVIDGYDPI